MPFQVESTDAIGTGQNEPRRMYGRLPTDKWKGDELRIPSVTKLKEIWENKEPKVDRMIKPLIARWADQKSGASAKKFAALTVIKDYRINKE